ncbi:hypothetical protein INR49_017598 [Caranx melampygus]|nr:hypothetical protein INR49_017598 [Caranx melampygus]
MEYPSSCVRAGQGRTEAFGQSRQEAGGTAMGSKRKNPLLKTTAILDQNQQRIVGSTMQPHVHLLQLKDVDQMFGGLG